MNGNAAGGEIPAVNVFNPHINERCKEMAKAALASVLILLLACNAQAGWVHNDVAARPPSSPQTAAAQEPTGGEISNDVSYSLAEIALDLLAVLPSLV